MSEKNKRRISAATVNDLRNQPYLNEVEVSAITGRAVSTLRNDRFLRRGIPYVKDGKRVMYRTMDVFNHMEARPINLNENKGNEQ